MDAHCRCSGYCHAFHVDTQDHTVFEIIIGVYEKTSYEDGGYHIATDWFYMKLDHVYYVFKGNGYFLYGTILSNCVPQHCNI